MQAGTNMGWRVAITGTVRVRSNRHISWRPRESTGGAQHLPVFWNFCGSVGACFRPMGHQNGYHIPEIDYLLRLKLIPCIEFELEHGFVYRQHHNSPGYYDGRYWTMWKLPMFGCTDSAQVLVELEEAKKAYPNGFIRIIGFDNVRQVQCISFIAYKPPGY
ncbi:hypothetical protein Pfo_008430 [Paulownia fortunei]|nr:hypothetical protein Pfo_008430 [Paulownia fortunei]